MEFVFILLYFAITSVVSLATYLLQSFGLNKMGKSLNVNNPWLAFIPYANVFAFGRIAEKYVKFNGKNSAKFSKILLTLTIIIAVLSVAISTFAIAVIVMGISDEFGNNIDTMALSGFLFAFLVTLWMGNPVSGNFDERDCRCEYYSAENRIIAEKKDSSGHCKL